MADEITIQYSLSVLNGNLQERRQTQFQADQTTAKGPTPGALTIPTTGEDISLAEVTTPGVGRVLNLDATNFVMVGIRDPDSDLFYPLVELLPGESYLMRFSRYLTREIVGTGTGTGTTNNFLHLRADTAACVVLLEIFDK